MSDVTMNDHSAIDDQGAGRAMTVVELRNALRCARLFVLGRARGEVVRFPMASAATSALFHRVIEGWSRTPERAGMHSLRASSSSDDIEQALIASLLDLLADELEREPMYASMTGAVDALADGLRSLARYVAQRIAARSEAPVDALRGLFSDTGVELDATLALDERRHLRVRGKIDALLAPSPFTIEAIEHELAGESDPDADEAQLALYRALLRAGRGIDATPRLLRFAPELEQRTLSGPRADELYTRAVLPILRSLDDWERGTLEPRPPLRALICGACPLRGPCAERWPEPLPARDHPTGGARFPRPAPDGTATDAAARIVFVDGDEDTAGQREAASLEASIAKAYRERGVSVSFPEAPRIGPRWIELDVSTRAKSVRELDRAVDDVVHVLLYKPGITVHFRKDGARRTFTVERAEPRVVKLASLIARERDFLSSRAGRFVLGEGVGGAVVRGDLSDPSCAHLLIGGATGAGKTQLLRSLAASLVHFHGPDALQLVLIDPKRVGLVRFAQTVSAHLRRPVVSESDDALALLDDLSGEMDERYARLESAGVEDVDELNREVSLRERLPRIVVIVDEFQALLGEGRGGGPFVEQISALGARARAAGIHLVLSTQRPDKKTLPGKLKDNLAGRVALRVSDAVASRIILDQAGAECLFGKGDLLAILDGEHVLRAQAALL